MFEPANDFVNGAPAPNMAEVLALPDGSRELALWLLRRGAATLPEIVQQVGQPADACQALLQTLAERGVVQRTDEGAACRYHVRAGRKRGHRISKDLV